MGNGGEDMAGGAVVLDAIDGDLAVRCERRDGGSGVLAVVFSQVRVPAGKFGLSRLFARTSHHGLFLNDLSGCWYRDLGPAIDRAVDAACAVLRPARVVHYGSSMGASGALAAACRRGDGKAIAFAPDPFVGAPGGQGAAAGLVPRAGEPHLADLLARSSSGAFRHDLVFGLFDVFDGGTAAQLAGLGPDVPFDLVPVASTHEVHDHLYSVNVVRRAISTFTRPIALEAATKGLVVADPQYPARAELAALSARLDAGDRVPAAAIDALGLSDEPGAARLAARAELRAGATAAAIVRLGALVDRLHEAPGYRTLPKRAKKQPALDLLALLRDGGEGAAARALGLRMAALYPEDARFGASPNDGA
ncbi:hypothetical protein [Methylobrevis pamukkalensis]|uniref:Alpha/beta hydrolase family protein n=1 Tax=Methylobrevis pamukkalensis TaxID=1439726 RepID=A0A1E3H3J7_9HYPH|nr:hypothetical protein [Methylobrevis pamukkalensis]ODN70864.1 hypothetical protein A6302_01781 [Methylobrevis pamukkalensis]